MKLGWATRPSSNLRTVPLLNSRSLEIWATLWLPERRHTHVNHTRRSPCRRLLEVLRYHVRGRQRGRNRYLSRACVSRLADTAGTWDGSRHRRAVRVGSSTAGTRGLLPCRYRLGCDALTPQGTKRKAVVDTNRGLMVSRNRSRFLPSLGHVALPVAASSSEKLSERERERERERDVTPEWVP